MRLIVFLNSHTVGLSGGDSRFIEIAKRLGDVDKIIVTSKSGQQMCEVMGLKAKYLITSNETGCKNIVLLYLKRIFKALFLEVKSKEGDVLYSTSDFLTDTLPAFLCKMKNPDVNWAVCIFLIIPTLFKDYSKTFTEVNRFSIPTINRFFYFISQRLTIHIAKWRADQILVLNELDKEYLINQRGVNKNLVTVVDGGISYNHFKNIHPPGHKIYDGIFVGRFHTQKGIFDLIRIWKLVSEKKPDARLGIIGSGSEDFEQKVDEFIGENKLEGNVDLLGFKYGDEKFSLLKSSEMFVYPSLYESWGIVIAEAMACGLPVVTYDLPIYKQIYEENILRVLVGNVNQFADILLKVLNDPQMMENMGRKGQEFIQKYDWDEIAEREINMLKNL